MPNTAPTFFNWFRRYRVRAEDMETLENSALDSMRGPWEGLTAAAVLDGFAPSYPGGLVVDLSEGIAVAASGYMLASTGASVELASPVGNPAKSLIVARPLLTETDPITRPTTPFDIVYLHENLACEIVVLDGTAASAPAYPTPEPNDVVLAAFRLAAGAASVAEANLDSDYRNDFGRNGGDVAILARGDVRCRPEIASQKTITIKPSQTINGLTKQFTYVGAAKPSIFPMTGGVFTEQDTTLNFETGAITGGDGDTPDFTPQIPTAGNFIWALVTLGTNNLLSVSYGTLGTYAQCKAALAQQTSTGAGSVPTAAAFKIAFVLIGSSNGSVVTELELVDARAPGSIQIGAVKSIVTVTTANSPYTMDGSEEVIELDATSGDISVTLPARSASQGREYAFDRIDTAANNALLNRAGSDTFDEPVYTTQYPFEPYQSQKVFAGSAKWKVRG